MSHPVIIVGGYDNRRRAELDFEALTSHKGEIQGHRAYAIALVERDSVGKVKIVNQYEPETEYGGFAGAVVGGLVGLLYLPLVVVTASAGIGIARVAAHLWHGVSRKDVAELGTALDSGEGAVLVLARQTPADVNGALPHATHIVHRETTHRHEDIEALALELRDMHDVPTATATS